MTNKPASEKVELAKFIHNVFLHPFLRQTEVALKVQEGNQCPDILRFPCLKEILNFLHKYENNSTLELLRDVVKAFHTLTPNQFLFLQYSRPELPVVLWDAIQHVGNFPGKFEPCQCSEEDNTTYNLTLGINEIKQLKHSTNAVTFVESDE